MINYQDPDAESSGSSDDEDPSDIIGNIDDPSMVEKNITSEMAEVKALESKFSRKEYFEYRDWLEERKNLIRWNRIVNKYDAENNRLDKKALLSIFPQEDTHLTDEKTKKLN